MRCFSRQKRKHLKCLKRLLELCGDTCVEVFNVASGSAFCAGTGGVESAKINLLLTLISATNCRSPALKRRVVYIEESPVSSTFLAPRSFSFSAGRKKRENAEMVCRRYYDNNNGWMDGKTF